MLVMEPIFVTETISDNQKKDKYLLKQGIEIQISHWIIWQ